MMRTLQASGLTLEPQQARHAEALFGLLNDPRLYAFENEPPPSLEWLRERFGKLETRLSGDGREQWLNWVVRLDASGEAIGYVQATVRPDASALIAYVLGSAYWGRGLATSAVRTMNQELAEHYAVRQLAAVLVRANEPSLALLRRLGFEAAALQQGIDAHELLMQRPLEPGPDAQALSARLTPP